MFSKIPPHGFTLFCDDVRTEDNGKSIFIGVYGPDMVVGQFPYSQPLSIITHLIIPENMKLQSCVFRLYQNENLLVELASDKSQIGENQVRLHAAEKKLPWPGQDTLPPGEQKVRSNAIKMIFQIDSIKFENPCALRARWDIGNQIIRAGSLSIISRADVEQRSQALNPASEQLPAALRRAKRSSKRKSD